MPPPPQKWQEAAPNAKYRCIVFSGKLKPVGFISCLWPLACQFATDRPILLQAANLNRRDDVQHLLGHSSVKTSGNAYAAFVRNECFKQTINLLDEPKKPELTVSSEYLADSEAE